MSLTPPAVPASAFTQWRETMKVEGQLRRALLRAARDGAVLQDQIDCAELANAGGLHDVARGLYGLIFLRVGFSPAGLALQREVAERTDLWSGVAADGPEAPGAAGFSVDIAIDELRQLMRLKPELGPEVDIGAVLPAFPPSPATRDVPSLDQARSLRDRVAACLRRVPEQPAGKTCEMICDLADDLVASPAVQLEDHLEAGLDELASVFVLRGLQAFLLPCYDLVKTKTPSTSMLHAASRLDPAALGPYLTNVRFVIRNVRDIFALIDVASGGAATAAEVECWCVLMSSHLSKAELLELIDELGDRGMVGALRRLLVRTARCSRVERPDDAPWRIRDAGLDIGDLQLGADAQHLVALWSPTNPLEWRILGDIRATAGDTAGAQSAFERCSQIDPAYTEGKERVTALRLGLFGPFKVTGGYATSPGRRRLRQSRLQAYRTVAQGQLAAPPAAIDVAPDALRTP